MKHIASNNSRSSLTLMDDKMISPNAVDLRLGKVFRLKNTLFVIDEDKKIHRDKEAIITDMNGYYYLEVGSYEIVMLNQINVGEREAGWVITRSTLNRNGVFITSGLYDSMYSGNMSALLNVTVGPMKIKKGTRIGQYLNFDAEMLHKYDGDYGENSSHDKIYYS